MMLINRNIKEQKKKKRTKKERNFRATGKEVSGLTDGCGVKDTDEEWKSHRWRVELPACKTY